MSLLRIILRLFVICTIFCSHAQGDLKNLKIGVISGLTGLAGKWNRFQNMGITLAKEELEREGINIDLVIEDSRSLGPNAISAFNKLLDFDHVDAVLADDFGYVIAPVLPFVKQSNTFFVALSLPQDRFCAEAPGYIYTMASQFSQSRSAFDHFFELHPEVKKIGVLVFDDQEWGLTYLGIWNDIAKKRNVEIVDKFLSTETSPDFKTVLTKMLSKKPQAIFLAHEPEGFFKTISQLRYQGPIVSANNILEMLADSPKPRPELEGVYLVDPNISAEFHQKFAARFGRPPILEAYAGYDALRVMAKAFTNNPKNPEEGIKHIAYDGVAGRIDFTGSSCAGNQASWGLYRFKHGEMLRQ